MDTLARINRRTLACVHDPSTTIKWMQGPGAAAVAGPAVAPVHIEHSQQHPKLSKDFPLAPDAVGVDGSEQQ